MPTEIAPWINRLREHRVAVGAVTALVVLVVALVWVAWRWGIAEDRMEMMQKQADAGFLQAVDAAPAWRGRQADAAGDLDQRHVAIVLQAIENLAVEGIEGNSRGHRVFLGIVFSILTGSAENEQAVSAAAP